MRFYLHEHFIFLWNKQILIFNIIFCSFHYRFLCYSDPFQEFTCLRKVMLFQRSHPTLSEYNLFLLNHYWMWTFIYLGWPFLFSTNYKVGDQSSWFVLPLWVYCDGCYGNWRIVGWILMNLHRRYFHVKFACPQFFLHNFPHIWKKTDQILQLTFQQHDRRCHMYLPYHLTKWLPCPWHHQPEPLKPLH